MSDGVASALAGPNRVEFEVRLEHWRTTLGNAGFVTFMSGSVASALVGPNAAVFQGRLEAWLVKLGTPKLFATFMNDSVASALVGPYHAAFELRMQTWFNQLVVAKKFVTFMKGGVASALVGPNNVAFQDCLQAWYTRLGRNKFVTFMCGSVASALVGPNSALFEARMQLLLPLFGEDFQTIVKNGVAARLADGGADGVQFMIDLNAAWNALTVEQRDVFKKFFGTCISKLKQLGRVPFWARVRAISITTPELSQKAAIQQMNA